MYPKKNSLKTKMKPKEYGKTEIIYCLLHQAFCILPGLDIQCVGSRDFYRIFYTDIKYMTAIAFTSSRKWFNGSSTLAPDRVQINIFFVATSLHIRCHLFSCFIYDADIRRYKISSCSPFCPTLHLFCDLIA